MKDEVWKLLGKISKFGPDGRTIAKVSGFEVKSTISNLFESLNFYFGPIDGHDVIGVAKVFKI